MHGSKNAKFQKILLYPIFKDKELGRQPPLKSNFILIYTVSYTRRFGSSPASLDEPRIQHAS